MLAVSLKGAQIKVVEAEAGADVDIVLAATKEAEKNDVVVVGEDTDLVVLLLRCIQDKHNLVFLKSEQQRKGTIWSIKLLQKALGTRLQHVLFAYAFLGCDTASRGFGIDKGETLKHL